MTTRITLSRELRFGLHADPAPTPAPNGFAANPALTGIAPFLLLIAQLSGTIDPATGMLINIKQVDRTLRDIAIPVIRKHCNPSQLPITISQLPQPQENPHILENLASAPLLVSLFADLSLRFPPAHLDLLTLSLSPYLSLAVSHKEPSMVQLSQRFEFSAAHRLHSPALSERENWEVFGRCTNPNGHGHNYELEVTLEGPPTAAGVVFPIAALQSIVTTRVIDLFDHKHLNLDCPEFAALNPTVENIAKVIHEKLAPAFAAPARLKHVRIWETPKTWAQYPA